MQTKIAPTARTAIRRSAKADGKPVITRRGREVSVGVNGFVHRDSQQITATVDTRRLNSSGESRAIEREWKWRRERFPEEHPFRSLDLAIFYYRAARRQAEKRVRGSRLRRW